jgi:hypothetical protein
VREGGGVQGVSEIEEGRGRQRGAPAASLRGTGRCVVYNVCGGSIRDSDYKECRGGEAEGLNR